jgi:hypothetical protein
LCRKRTKKVTWQMFLKYIRLYPLLKKRWGYAGQTRH